MSFQQKKHRPDGSDSESQDSGLPCGGAPSEADVRPLQVLVTTPDTDVVRLVRDLVGREAQVLVQRVPPFPEGLDLIVVDPRRWNGEAKDWLASTRGGASVLVLPSSGRFSALLSRLVSSLDPSRRTYRDVVQEARSPMVREYIVELLERFGGNVTKAAHAAGLERESLYRVMRRHDLQAGSFRTRLIARPEGRGESQ